MKQSTVEAIYGGLSIWSGICASLVDPMGQNPILTVGSFALVIIGFVCLFHSTNLHRKGE